MHSGSAHLRNLQVDDNIWLGGQSFGAGANTAGSVYYVDRNHNGGNSSGDGSSWDQAFLTIGEAIAKVNADYTAAANTLSKGRNRYIFVGEGWYGEVPLVLTANDVYLIGVAPGSHDSTVLYGSATAGGFDIGSGGPALTLGGSNCTIINMGFFTYDNTEPSVADGGHSSDTQGYLSTFNNKFINCNFIRDVADGAIGGLQCKSNEGPVIQGCTFSTSCMDYGVQIGTNGVTNPVNVIIEGCRFTGTPIGVDANAGHNAIVRDCVFMDDTTDRADTIDLPVDCNGSTNTAVYNCYSEFSNADISDNGTSPLAINNFHLATPA